MSTCVWGGVHFPGPLTFVVAPNPRPHTLPTQFLTWAQPPPPSSLSLSSSSLSTNLSPTHREEERTHFRELLASSVYRACPLLAIREQLQGQIL